MSAAKPDVCCLHTILCVYRGCGFVFGVVVSAATFRCGSAAHLVLISFLKDATVLHCIARMHSTHTEGLTNERAGLKRRARVAFAFHPALFTVVYSNHPSVGFFLSSFPLSLFFFWGGGGFLLKPGVFSLCTYIAHAEGCVSNMAWCHVLSACAVDTPNVSLSFLVIHPHSRLSFFNLLADLFFILLHFFPGCVYAGVESDCSRPQP